MFVKRIITFIIVFIGIASMPFLALAQDTVFIQNQNITFTQEEQDYIRNLGILKAVSLDGSAPLQYRNSKGEIKGISINILKEIETLTGLTFEYVLCDNVEEINRSDADILFGFSKEYRQKNTTTSTPYLYSEAVLFYNSSLDLKDLKGKRFAMVESGKKPDEIKEEDIIYFKSREATIKAVNKGEADYGYSNSYSLFFHILQNGCDNVVTIPQKREDRGYCIGVPEDNKILLNIINKAIEGIDENQIQNLTLLALAEVEKKITLSAIIDNYKEVFAGLGFLCIAALLYMVLLKENANKRLSAELLKVRKQEEIITQMSLRDSLTGLYNRSYLDNELVGIDNLEQLPISIIVADINGLKAINDSFGHSEGDMIIQKAASVLKKSCRAEDVVVRTGGDEFIIILPKTPIEATLQVIERIDEHCNKECNSLIPINISAGYAIKNNPEEDIESIIKEADTMMYRHKLSEGQKVRKSIIASLQASLREKGIETEEHTNRLLKTTSKMGEKLKLSPRDKDDLNLLVKLHNIGKITIDEGILKKKGRLTQKEINKIKQHPETGYRIVESTQIVANIAKYILHHHEHWDGKGYPHGLKGEEIPLLSRILAIADAYDAMTNDREYREAMTKEMAINELKRCSGQQFDPNLVPVFISTIEEL